MASEPIDQTRPRRGRPPRSADERAAQRRRLVEGSIQGVRDRGPDLSIDDLATAAGVSKPVLYDEFGGKLGIADAIAVVLAEDVERRVLDDIAESGEFESESAIRSVIDALIDVIVNEPELYAFMVRSIRASDRGFLDNALVRVIHDRARQLVGLVAPGVAADHLAVLTDGLFGFVFAAVESWHETRRPARDDLVHALTTVIRRGIEAVADELGDAWGSK